MRALREIAERNSRVQAPEAHLNDLRAGRGSVLALAVSPAVTEGTRCKGQAVGTSPSHNHCRSVQNYLTQLARASPSEGHKTCQAHRLRTVVFVYWHERVSSKVA